MRPDEASTKNPVRRGRGGAAESRIDESEPPADFSSVKLVEVMFVAEAELHPKADVNFVAEVKAETGSDIVEERAIGEDVTSVLHRTDEFHIAAGSCQRVVQAEVIVEA